MAVNLQSPPDPVQVSWSSLKRWENCPQHQLRIIKHETEKQNKGRIFLPGTVCDLAQRRFLDDEHRSPGDMAASIETIFKETVEKAESKILWKGNPNTDMAAVQKFCRETVTTLEPWLYKNVLPYGFAAEHKFKAHMEIPYLRDGVRAPIKLIGGLDIIVQDDQGKFRLYDLKVTKNHDYIKSTLAQLIFYDIAWCIINGAWDSCVEWGFITPAIPNEPYIPIIVTEEDRRIMMSRVVKYAQGVWNDNWAPKADDVGCNWCEARGMCQKFKTVPIVEANGKQRLSFADAAKTRSAFRAP